MGLDRELFEGDIDDEFLCSICHQVLLNPVTAGCSHISCQACVIRRSKSRVAKSVCPVCSSNLTLDMTDTSVEFKLKLLNLNIQCTHKCGELFVLAELPDHMETCPNAPVDCDFRSKGCKKTVKRCDKRKHTEECDYRDVECEACGFQTIYRELFTHQSRVRCLEKKLKQQIIRERKAASRELIRHREKLHKDGAKLDQQQRKRIMSHAKSLSNRKYGRQSVNEDNDTEFDYSGEEGVFLTEDLVLQHNQQDTETEELQRIQLTRHATKTPHSSRSGFATHLCSQCNRKFKPDTNTDTSCRWHIGPMIQVFGGTCFACGRLDYQPGCAVGLHRI